MKMIRKLLILMILMISTLLIVSGQANASEAPVLRHTVVKGERLIKIAEQFAESHWATIAKVNKLKNPDLIHPGQVLIIPVLAKADSPVERTTDAKLKVPTFSSSASLHASVQGSANVMRLHKKDLNDFALQCTGMTKNQLSACIATQKNSGARASKNLTTSKFARSEKIPHRTHGIKFANSRKSKTADMSSSRDRYTTATVVVPPEPTLGDVANNTYLQLKSALEEIIDQHGVDVTPLAKVLYEKYKENGNTVLLENETKVDPIVPHSE